MCTEIIQIYRLGLIQKIAYISGYQYFQFRLNFRLLFHCLVISATLKFKTIHIKIVSIILISLNNIFLLGTNKFIWFAVQGQKPVSQP
jgi:hypothetical protein